MAGLSCDLLTRLFGVQLSSLPLAPSPGGAGLCLLLLELGTRVRSGCGPEPVTNLRAGLAPPSLATVSHPFSGSFQGPSEFLESGGPAQASVPGLQPPTGGAPVSELPPREECWGSWLDAAWGQMTPGRRCCGRRVRFIR